MSIIWNGYETDSDHFPDAGKMVGGKMDKQTIQKLQNQFDAMSNNLHDGVEFWFARDLQEPLGYARWENFLTAIKRAIESCDTTGYNVSDHFRGVAKLITHGKGGQREIEDFMLTRYAC